MASVLSHEENKAILESQDPINLSSARGAEGVDPGAPSAAPSQGAQPQAASQGFAQPAGSTQQGTGYSYQPGQSAFGQITGGITRGVGERQQELGEEAQRFYSEAGPQRTYESAGAETSLAGALGSFSDPGARDSAIGTAQSLVGARYEGPSGFSQEAASRIQSGAEDLATRAQALRTGSGLQTLYGQVAPGLSAGQRRFEAQQTLSRPDYRQEVRGYTQSVQDVLQDLEREQARASEFATTRAEQEADIAERSREYLTGRQTGVSQDIEREIGRQKEQQAAAQEAYSRFLETGDVNVLAEPGAALEPGIDPQQFLTSERAKAQEAIDVYEDIMARYPTLEGKSLDLGTTDRGREAYFLGDKPLDYLGRPDTLTPEERLLVQRQKELEKFFSPGNARFTDEGQYATELPLYYGGSDNPLDTAALGDLPEIRNYVSFDPGVSPARENVSTEEQKRVFNRVSEILGEVNRIGDAGEPFRAAMIAADIEQYLNDEQRVLESREKELDAREAAWLGQVRRARKQYRKAKKKKKWGKIARVFTDVMSAGSISASKDLLGEDMDFIEKGTGAIVGGREPPEKRVGTGDTGSIR